VLASIVTHHKLQASMISCCAAHVVHQYFGIWLRGKAGVSTADVLSHCHPRIPRAEGLRSARGPHLSQFSVAVSL
jgi:hypothetical protein